MDAISGIAPVEGAAFERGPPRQGFWRGGPRGSNTSWALAFLVPYAAVFLLFVVYPVGTGCGWGITRRATGSCSPIRSICAPWPIR